MSYPRQLIWSEKTKPLFDDSDVSSFAVRVTFTGEEKKPFKFEVIRKD